MNILTGRCDEVKYGQCAFCGGNLTNGHTCPQMEAAAREALAMKEPSKLARMIRIWAAATGIEQAEIAKAWDSQPSTVSRFLNGNNLPDGKTMARIIAWLLEP